MKTNKIIPSVVASALLTFAGFASASDAITLTDKQMDKVAAGTTLTVFSGSTAEAFAKRGYAEAGTTTQANVSRNRIQTSSSGGALAEGKSAWAATSSYSEVVMR